ncbi:hypothetical protein SANA_11020 [Gottschalkiaceae bacterium SANA]|nr:hypothetical protein SANA_11020 [Gottschalkiaceae bacterium SANA]
MENSFLYKTYQAISKRMMIILLILSIVGGLTIYHTTNDYVFQFEEVASRFIELSRTEAEDSIQNMLNHWVSNDIWNRTLEDGKTEDLDLFLTERISHKSISDAVVLFFNGENLSYEYGDHDWKADFASMGIDANASMATWYQWESNTLWAKCISRAGDVTLLLAYPVTEANLLFLKVPWIEKSIANIEIGDFSTNENRDLFHWQTIVRSYPIDSELPAYINVEYTLHDLGRYFYLPYGLYFIMAFGLYIFFKHQYIKSAFLPATNAIKRLESQVELIGLGDYNHRMVPSGYQEFVGLENEINGLSMAIQMRNERLEQDVVEVYALLIKMLEFKDPYTKGHSERVANYSLKIANYLDCDEESNIYSAALLHDIGKVGIPGKILKKPGSLTTLEFEEVKTHSMKGVEMLSGYSQFQSILDGVRYHHERLDGSGYPQGLVGEMIPIAARIIAVADVFDALTSDRSYRDAMSVGRAIAILQDGKGVLYDGDIVDALIFCIQEEEAG